MGWFNIKKEDSNIPRLPDLPSIGTDLPPLKEPELPPGLPDIEINSLPALPNIESNRKAENTIKDTLAKPTKINQEKIPEIETPRVLEISSDYEPKTSLKKLEPIYIRLDKFDTTRDSFEEIRTKVQEIEHLLNKAKQIKAEEEKELDAWEHEIQVIKSRLDSIDKTLFNKLD